MQKSTLINNLTIVRSHIAFLLPLGYDSKRKNDVIKTLIANHYEYFQIEKSTRKNYYGSDITVDGKELDQYFLPYVEHKLFPSTYDKNGFHRFSISIEETFNLQIRKGNFPFIIQSIDIILVPFGIAFMTIRAELVDRDPELSDVLDFMNHFRAVEPKIAEEKGAKIVCPDNRTLASVHDLLFDYLCPFLKEYIIHEKKLNGHFGSLPYFEDERMYGLAFLFSSEGAQITDDQLYRIGALDGRSPDGRKFISANNPSYIRQVLDQTLHDRWGPSMYTVTTEHAFITVTNRPPDEMVKELSHFMGTHYYNFLLHYFYKIILLRVTFEHSKLNWNKDAEYVKSLIKLITLFSSWYYFQEISTRSEGKELSKMFRRSFAINRLYDEVKNTLQELYKNQENINSERMNKLLFALTVFTVISGIYGMNLVIEDWKTKSGWNEFLQYNLYEWIALITAISGIGLSAYLIVSTFGKNLLKKLRNNKDRLHL